MQIKEIAGLAWGAILGSFIRQGILPIPPKVVFEQESEGSEGKSLQVSGEGIL